jgi:hypothetical protein
MFTFTDVSIVIATLAGPVLAVQAQKFIERSRETRSRKLNIFHTLMATRGLKAASFEHVQALNSIDIVFNSKKNKEKKIISAWSEYLDHLNNFPQDNDDHGQRLWNQRSTDLLVAMLQAIGSSLGYDFTSVQLKRGVYYPRGHDEDIAARIALRHMLTQLSKGTWSLPLDVRSFAVDPAAMKLQLELQSALLSALSGRGALNVAVANRTNPGPTKSS